jgi:amino acid adenylation domain-containing protein
VPEHAPGVKSVSGPSSWFDAVAATARRDPGQIAFSEGERSLTYADLVRQSVGLAAWLYDHGLRSGDRLGIHLRKGFEEILATLAAVRLGAVFVHVHPHATLAQLRHIVLDSGIRILITDVRRATEALADPLLAAQLSRVVVVGKGASPMMDFPSLDGDSEENDKLPLPQASPDQLGALLYTSGSTGKPKGVMHSHRNLLAFAANVAEYLDASANDRVLGLLPINFSYGLNQALTTLYVGGTLVLPKAPFPADIVKTLVEKRITGLAAVPSVWSQLLTYLDQKPTDLSWLRYVTNAGGKLPERNALRLRQHLPHTDIILMYGSTEALRTTYLAPELFSAKLGAMGKPIPNVEVFVLGSDGKLCGPGQQGELLQRGGHVSQGYWNNPDETALRFHGCPALRDFGADERVYHSGDIVRIDEDGVLWFVSRADWMVKSGGFRFSLEEVESLLTESGLVAEAAVFSVDDDTMGQVVHAVVAAKVGDELDRSVLWRYCWKAMPSHMIPRTFQIWQSPLPVLPNGKLDRVSLRRQIDANSRENAGGLNSSFTGDVC